MKILNIPRTFIFFAFIFFPAAFPVLIWALPDKETELMQSGEYSFPAFEKSSISLIQAVEMALQHHPDISIEKETVLDLKGSIMKAEGQFDTVLGINVTGEYLQHELTPQELNNEFGKRELQRIIAETTDRMAKGSEPSDNIQIDFSDIINDLMGSNTDENDRMELEDIEKNIYSSCDPNIETIEGFYRCLSDRAQAKLEALGPIPKVTETYSSSLKISLSQPFRNGIVVTPRIMLDMNNRQFRDKPRDKARGGTGEKETWTSDIGFDFLFPLGKGWGEVSTGAMEKAAQYNYESGQHRLRHTISQQVYDVMNAYWDTVAAQKKLQLWEDSKVRLQHHLVTIGNALVEAGEIPPVDMERISARAATVFALATQARRAEKESRIRLAGEIGLNVDRLSQAPSASDAFPDTVSKQVLNKVDSPEFIREAIERRDDYRASLKICDSSKALLAAARDDLKYKKDLTLSIYYQGWDQDSSILNGISEVLFEELTGPSIMLTFNMEWPFGNNRAKGNLEQANATWRKSRINSEDTKRKIASDVMETCRALKDAAEKILLGIDAAGYQRQILDASVENLKAGNITLIDVLTPAEQFPDSLISLSDAKLDYAKFLARLRFETGTMLSSHQETAYRIDADELLTIPFIEKKITVADDGLSSSETANDFSSGIISKLRGHITAILVKPGDFVKQGDIVATISPSELISRIQFQEEEIKAIQQWCSQQLKELEPTDQSQKNSAVYKKERKYIEKKISEIAYQMDALNKQLTIKDKQTEIGLIAKNEVENIRKQLAEMQEQKQQYETDIKDMFLAMIQDEKALKHEVKAGEKLSGICLDYYNTYEKTVYYEPLQSKMPLIRIIQEFNNMESHRLKAGQIIRLPEIREIPFAPKYAEHYADMMQEYENKKVDIQEMTVQENAEEQKNRVGKIKESENEIAQIQQETELLEITLLKQSELLDRGLITKRNILETERKLNALNESKREAENRLAVLYPADSQRIRQIRKNRKQSCNMRMEEARKELELMEKKLKISSEIKSSCDGVVKELRTMPGDIVDPDQIIMIIERQPQKEK